ncbi:hypothetical protein Poly51_03760 [Rubripirellula tenax]|uniref:Uncharacterized protein n=1 Tax=Rubripirellula tenax TaxID=2528015 RepID=A0A5C6FKB0_9BACT|nr:hypothetical protein [Rubripirellula tenax]TWU60102.1 hypothetical protein Poly51_03760 [Rubripirellula tenax]
MNVSTPQNYRFLRTGSLTRRRPDRGIVLLIALGMLGLFSILVVTYVVFTSQARQASASISRQATSPSRPNDLMEEILTQVLVGSPDPNSVTYGNDMMGDLYGYDSLRTRVAHRRTGAPNVQIAPLVRGQLYDVATTPELESTLFRFPMRFSRWNHDGNAAFEQQLPENQAGYDGPIVYPNATVASDPWTIEQFDDAYVGRICTFLEGPLKGHSFHIVRSFGEDSSATPPANYAGTLNDESMLQYNLVIDLSELPTDEIQIDGTSYDLWTVAREFPMALLYGPGPDNAPGEVDRNDGVTQRTPYNTIGAVDDLLELGTSDSDDVGYQFVINGQIFNGRGVDAGFAAVPPYPLTSQLTAVIPRDSFGNTRHPIPGSSASVIPYSGWVENDESYAVQPNSRFLGPLIGSEPDEPYDAADLENLFLAWQPSERPVGVNNLHPGEPTVNALINQAIVPSYHRPALFNYLMNEPVTDNNGANPRTFGEMLAMSQPQDAQRLARLVRRLRRACMRPLPFSGNTEDLDGDGEQVDGTPYFSGSNPTLILNESLDPDGDANQILRLARWLVNGPWDVDNDGDGVPDSIWVDFQLPSFTAADGTLVKPMVAPLMEDLDGRININTAGSFSQLAYNFFDLDPSHFSGFTADNKAAPTASTPRLMRRGLGVGPAEINPRLLLDPYRANHFVWSTATPTTEPNPFFLGMNNRNLMFQVLSARSGGGGQTISAPGVDETSTSPVLTVFDDDLVSQTIHPVRRPLHDQNAPMGIPMDMHGRSRLDINVNGNLVVQNLDANVPGTTPLIMNETINDPYEIATKGSSLGNDDPFTLSELVSVLNYKRPGAGAVRTRLLELLESDLINGNNELETKITTESRSQRNPEFMGFANATDFIADLLRQMPGYASRWAGASTAQRNAAELAVKRMLAIEIRKGTKLNLNRPLGNGADATAGTYPEFIDEPAETASEAAFPGFNAPSSTAIADYVPTLGDSTVAPESQTNDFTDLTAQELLARNIYSLMFALVRDPAALDPTMELLIPNFPYPPQFRFDAGNPRAIATATGASIGGEIQRANRYAARRLAQWAVNVVDFRDHDAIMTRFRYDEDPFDADGWADNTGVFQTVWGKETSDIQITEASSFHDMRTADTSVDDGANDMGPEEKERDGTAAAATPDADVDQLRIPQASSFVELLNTRTPVPTGSLSIRYPNELYGYDHDNDATTPLINTESLHLARTVGTGTARTPVWRLAVGVPAGPASPYDVPRWLMDAGRLKDLVNDPFAEAPVSPWPPSAATAPIVTPDDIAKATERYRHTADFELGGDLLAFEDNDPMDNHSLVLDRVVWFTDLDPSALNPAALGGVAVEQVYRNILASNPNAPPALAPGQFAVIAPRTVTRLGEKASVVETNAFLYDPSDQRFELEFDGNGNNTWTFKYYNLNDTTTSNEYFEDAPGNFRYRGILPIVAQAQRPVRPDWNQYFTQLAAQPDRQVDFGFNISAPNPNITYYPAPLFDETLNDTLNPGAGNLAYPLFDSYYDAEGMAGNPLDQPVDELPGAPLLARGWRGGGTHQDAATLFLQRLADPTRIYDATTNPYITVDVHSMDLTVYSGHEDLGSTVTVAGNPEPVDPLTLAYTDTMRMDTRRKIPDTSNDRYAHIAVAGTPTALVNRSMLGYRQNVLQTGTLVPPLGPNAAHFSYQFQTGLGTAATYETGPGANLDLSATPFPETFGYLNREWGMPRASSGIPPALVSLVGLPDNTLFAIQPWLDRDYSSPIEIASVSASSTVRFGMEYGPGTVLDANPSTATTVNESTVQFPHLLGFDTGYNPLVARPLFEQIFDFADTGPIYADGEKWVEPTQVDFVSAPPPGFRSVDFNRITETLRPPFNSISLHRVPGKINPNTTPDYAAVAGGTNVSVTNFDRLENPADPDNGTANASRYSASGAAGFGGDGSVYQSLAWGFSTFAEIDNLSTLPTIETESNLYASTQDSPYGYNFKGFIESRTGFTQTTPLGSLSSPRIELQNRQVDPRYPSRFVGVFAPMSAQGFPLVPNAAGVTSFNSYLQANKGLASQHDKHRIDLSLFRPHPDMDDREFVGGTLPLPNEFNIRTEPALGGNPEWRSRFLNTPLFERPQSELHREDRLHDHIDLFRYQNAAKLANLTTNHSNVFLMRFTVGYFRLDAQSGEVGQEYGFDTNQAVRYRGTAILDRSIPVSYERGKPGNTENAVIYKSGLE